LLLFQFEQLGGHARQRQGFSGRFEQICIGVCDPRAPVEDLLRGRARVPPAIVTTNEHTEIARLGDLEGLRAHPEDRLDSSDLDVAIIAFFDTHMHSPVLRWSCIVIWVIFSPSQTRSGDLASLPKDSFFQMIESTVKKI
jgi:hypothetical protein